MKHRIWIVSFLFALVCACLCFVGCNKKEGPKRVECEVLTPTQTEVLISVSELTGEWTLQECMEQLAEEGELTYTLSDGMITKINGKANEGNSYWMLYTSDTEFSSSAWGTVSIDGQTYASSILGAEILPVKAGCSYIWSYQSF